MAVAIFLTYETKSLLIGEAADPKTLASVREITEADTAVNNFVRARTMHFGPEVVLLNMDLLFKPELSCAQVADAIDRLEKDIRAQHPEVRYIYLEAKAVTSEKRDQCSV